MTDRLSYLAIGSVGTGFLEESLNRGISGGVDFIGADAGSVDGGPTALAGAGLGWSDLALPARSEPPHLGSPPGGSASPRRIERDIGP